MAVADFKSNLRYLSLVAFADFISHGMKSGGLLIIHYVVFINLFNVLLVKTKKIYKPILQY